MVISVEERGECVAKSVEHAANSDDSGTDYGQLRKVGLVLSCFKENKPSLGLSELSRSAGLPKTTTLRIASSLCELRLLYLDSVTKQYRLGYRILELAQIIRGSNEWVKVARSIMEKLRDQIEESVALVVASERSGICIERVESLHALRFASPIGEKVPLYAGAARKVLLAYLTHDEIIEIVADQKIRKITENTVIKTDDLLIELEKIREEQVAISFGEHSPGVSAIAVPIFAGGNQPIASLVIAGPSVRLTREKMMGYLPLLRECSEKITSSMGHHQT
jgi:DNA-binding IclR family transcriptional regulator